MPTLLNQTQWDKFNAAINNASDTFNTTTITWHRKTIEPFNYGEESRQYQPITLKALVDYNDTGNSPVDRMTESGKVDDTDVVIYLNNKQLDDGGYIDSNGIFIFDQGEDFFEFGGEQWIDMGKTPASPTDEHSLHTIMILSKRPRTNFQKMI